MTSRGYTVIEMMTVLLVVGALAALALPAMQGFLASGRIRGSSMDLLADLYVARSEALRLNTTVTVSSRSGGTDWSGGWTVTCAGPAACARALRTRDAYSSVSMRGGSASFSFSMDGRLDEFAAQNFTVYAAAAVPQWVRMRCVDIDPSGRPRAVADRDTNPANGC